MSRIQGVNIIGREGRLLLRLSNGIVIFFIIDREAADHSRDGLHAVLRPVVLDDRHLEGGHPADRVASRYHLVGGVLEPRLDLMGLREKIGDAFQSQSRQQARSAVDHVLIAMIQEILILQLLMDLLPRPNIRHSINSRHHSLLNSLPDNIPFQSFSQLKILMSFVHRNFFDFSIDHFFNVGVKISRNLVIDKVDLLSAV